MEKKQMKKDFNLFATALIVFLVGVFVIASVASIASTLFFPEDKTGQNSFYALFGYLAQYLVLVPLVIYIIIRCKKGEEIKISSLLKKPTVPTKTVFRYVIIALGFTYGTAFVSNIFFTFIQSFFDVSFSTPSMVSQPNLFSQATNVLAMMILAPFFEELLFRGALLKLTRPYGAWFSIFIGAIFFGLWHMNYQQSIYTAALGFATCFLVVKTNSIIPSYIVHLSLNTIGSLQSVVLGYVDTSIIDEITNLSDAQIASYLESNMQQIVNILPSLLFTIIMGITVITLIILAIVFLYHEIVRDKNFFKLQGDNENSFLKQTGLFFTRPLCALVALLFLAMTVIMAMQ